MIADWASYALADFIPFTAEVYARLVERVNEAGWVPNARSIGPTRFRMTGPSTMSRIAARPHCTARSSPTSSTTAALIWMS